MSGVQQLKVDITTLELEDPQYCTLILNFNIPASIVENNVPYTYDEVLDNISQYIVNNFNTNITLTGLDDELKKIAHLNMSRRSLKLHLFSND